MRRATLAVIAIVFAATTAHADRLVFRRGSTLWWIPMGPGDMQQLLGNDDYVYDASFSADGKVIALSLGYDTYNVDVRRVDGKAEKIAGKPLDRGHDPIVSADGKRIAYGCEVEHMSPSSESDWGGATAVCASDRDGKHKVKLGAGERPLGWQKDGVHVVWVAADHQQVMIGDATTGAAVRGAKIAADSFWMIGLSHDGTRIAGPAGDKLRIAPVAGGNATTIDVPAMTRAYCAWSPDDSHIACAVYPATGDEALLMVFTPDGKPGVKITDHVMSTPLWSRDGKQLAYTRKRNLALVDATPGAMPTVFTNKDLDDAPIAWLP